MSAEAKNFEAIVKAKDAHNKACPFPPHTVRMNPFEIERMQWEEGDTIAGLVLEADGKLGTGAFRLVCDGMEPPELELEETDVIERPLEPIVVPVGPAREDERVFDPRGADKNPEFAGDHGHDVPHRRRRRCAPIDTIADGGDGVTTNRNNYFVVSPRNSDGGFTVNDSRPGSRGQHLQAVLRDPVGSAGLSLITHHR